MDTLSIILIASIFMNILLISFVFFISCKFIRINEKNNQDSNRKVRGSRNSKNKRYSSDVERNKTASIKSNRSLNNSIIMESIDETNNNITSNTVNPKNVKRLSIQISKKNMDEDMIIDSQMSYRDDEDVTNYSKFDNNDVTQNIPIVNRVSFDSLPLASIENKLAKSPRNNYRYNSRTSPRDSPRNHSRISPRNSNKNSNSRPTTRKGSIVSRNIARNSFGLRRNTISDDYGVYDSKKNIQNKFSKKYKTQMSDSSYNSYNSENSDNSEFSTNKEREIEKDKFKVNLRNRVEGGGESTLQSSKSEYSVIPIVKDKKKSPSRYAPIDHQTTRNNYEDCNDPFTVYHPSTNSLRKSS